MPLLYHWRGDNYRRDLDMGAGYHLNQANPLLHEIELGDTLWAFTRNRAGAYVLAAALVVKAKTINSPRFRYGRYRIWGDLKLSRYFLTECAPSAEAVIRALSIKTGGEVLGRAFQGYAAVRRITAGDHSLLEGAARALLLEPRARIMPEDRIEAELLLDDAAGVQRLVADSGISEERRRYLFTESPTRNRRLVAMLRERYAGRCQLCGWDPASTYCAHLCEAHHMHWLSRGGADELENLVLVCPNHHTAIHRCDAQFDWGAEAFDFGTWREPLLLKGHLSP
jgi:5-methylcytosine-specific restriction enzyme A